MSEMKTTVGAWNMHNSFGDGRAKHSLEVVKRMDVDTLFLCEMTFAWDQESEHYLEVSDAMKDELGYRRSIVTNYSPFEGVRDIHTMAMWTRDERVQAIERKIYGQRYGLKLYLPQMGLEIVGEHLDDVSEDERLRSAEATVADRSEDKELVVMGDLNAMNRRDPKSRMPRALGRLVRHVEVDYYDKQKRVQRFAGKVLRVCRMAEGRALAVYEQAGLEDADPQYFPTIRHGRLAYQLDHILASKHLHVEDFALHELERDVEGRLVSDHTPITATVVR